MNPRIQSLLNELREFDASAEGVGLELRLSVSKILLKHLRSRGWTQSRLAEQAEMKEPQLSRIIHSDANCTVDTIGKLLFALGIRAQIQEAPPLSQGDTMPNRIRLVAQESTYGQEDYETEDCTTLKIVEA